MDKAEKDTLSVRGNPGAMLAEKLEELQMPVQEFAELCQMPEKTIEDFVKGTCSLTPEMADIFEEILRIPATLWMNMQSGYDEYQKSIKD